MRYLFIALLITTQLLWGEYYTVDNIRKNDTLSLRSYPDIKAKKIGELSYNASAFKILIVVNGL